MKTKKIKFLFLLAIVCHTITTFAVPAFPGLIKKAQPDGTEISLYLKGDERVHWMESEDGYTLMYNADKYIVYAEQDVEKNMIPSKSIYGKMSAPQSVRKGIRYSDSQVRALTQIRTLTETPPRQAAQPIGSRKALCILMGFSDKDFTTDKSKFETLFNQVGLYNSTTHGSVRDYYLENSYGKLDLTVTIAGPYKAQNTCKYYANHVQAFAREAALAADSDVDYNYFAVNGILESFHILFAGYGDEAIQNGEQIWSEEWQLASPLTLDGVRVSVFSCSPEFSGSSGSNITNIGVICHEMCHTLGAPDFYDVDYSGFDGTGQWDLMAEGSWNGQSNTYKEAGKCPAHINMYQKIQFGWVVPNTLNQMKAVTGMLNSANNPVAYRYDTPTSGEYYILENRQKVGFDSYVPGTGLLIYHVSVTNSDISSNTVNTKHPQKMYPVCASATTNPNPTGTPAAYGNINSSGCPFPGSSNNKSFTDYTTPAAVAWNGANTNKPVTQIQEQSGVISFNFLMPDPDQISNFQATVVNQSNVQLTWEKPAEDSVIGYNIYRDDQLVIKLTGRDNTSYTQYNVKSGNYNYCVSALYSDKESVSICKSVQITNSSINNTYLSVRNIKSKSINGKDIELSWESPYTDKWVSYAGDFKDYLSLSYTQFVSAVKFTTDDLQNFVGSKVTKVRFPINDLQCKYTIQLWLTKAGSRNPTGTPFFEQAVTNPDASDNNFEVTLNTPIDITGDNDLWIGIKYEASPKVFVGIDEGPMVSGCNFMFVNNQWSSVSSLNNFNWFISGYLQHESSPLNSQGNTWLRSTTATSIPQNYVIYRDNIKINTTTQPQYIDTPPPADYHIYCVSVAYSDGKESEPVCIEASTNIITSLDPVNNMENEISIYPNPIKKGETLVINCIPNTVSTLSVYTVSGQLLQYEKINGPVSYKKMDFEPGIYLLQIKNDSKTFICKIIVK